MKDEIKEITKQMETIEAQAQAELDMQEHPLAVVEYNVKQSEENDAFLAFQRRFVYKQTILKTVVFGLVALLFIIRLIFNPTAVVFWVGLAICIAAIAIFWYNPIRIRRTILESIKPLADDRYIFKLYDDKLSVETILPDEDRYDENGNEVKIKPTVIKFSDISLKVLEMRPQFVLFLKRESIYVIPKRCMEEYQVNVLRSVFEEKLGEDFEMNMAEPIKRKMKY